jgi:undecaprenyl-diphosphatase
MPDWLAVVLLGVIEGLTEFIPVSSTGHLLIAERWLPRQSDLFKVVIQSAAVLAVLPLFSGRCRQVLASWRDAAGRDYFLKLAGAFLITAAGGLILEKFDFQLPDEPTPVAVALILGGIAFLVVERWLRGRTGADQVTWAIAIAVGAGQLVAAVFPGTSRSGATILLALVLGLSRPAATEFSFLVSIPTMLAAGGVKVLKAFKEGAPAENWSMILLGIVVSMGISFIAVKWFLRFVQSHTFVGFGWYRIVLGILLLLILL